MYSQEEYAKIAKRIVSGISKEEHLVELAELYIQRELQEDKQVMDSEYDYYQEVDKETQEDDEPSTTQPENLKTVEEWGKILKKADQESQPAHTKARKKRKKSNNTEVAQLIQHLQTKGRHGATRKEITRKTRISFKTVPATVYEARKRGYNIKTIKMKHSKQHHKRCYYVLKQ